MTQDKNIKLPGTVCSANESTPNVKSSRHACAVCELSCDARNPDGSVQPLNNSWSVATFARLPKLPNASVLVAVNMLL